MALRLSSNVCNRRILAKQPGLLPALIGYARSVPVEEHEDETLLSRENLKKQILVLATALYQLHRQLLLIRLLLVKIKLLPRDNAVQLPSGLSMYYTKLKMELDEDGREQYSYKTRMGYIKIYGGKVIENVCQAIARCVMAEQMLEIQKKYRVLLTVHDSVVCCVPDEQVTEACTYIDSCMAYVPEWASGLPVCGDVEIGKNYGECIEWVQEQHGHSVA